MHCTSTSQDLCAAPLEKQSGLWRWDTAQQLITMIIQWGSSSKGFTVHVLRVLLGNTGKGFTVHVLRVLLGNTGEGFKGTLSNIKLAGADADM